MTSAHESPQTILQQICSPEASREDVAVVVRLDDGNLRLNPRDSCFEEFLTYLHPKVAIKACTPALNSLLAATGSTASLVDVGDGIELPIYDSLASVPRRVASQAAAIIRDVPALVVWSDDADSIAQWFLHVEHRIRHSTRMCSCAAFPPLTSDSSRTASNSDSTQGDDCLLTSSSGDESIDWFLFDEPSVALSELEVPLAVAPSFDLDEHRDGGVSPPQIRLDGNGSVTVDISTLHERLSAGFSASDSLLPLSSSRSSDLHPTSTIPHEQQTISPMLLQSSTYTPDSATLSPLSPSYAPLCSVYTAASPLRTPSTITLDIDSDSPAMKASSPESGRELDADWMPPRSPSSPALSSQSSRLTSPVKSPSFVAQATPIMPSQPDVAAVPTKRKRGPSNLSQSTKGKTSLSRSRARKPLPKRRSSRMTAQTSKSASLHPLPGRPVLPSYRRGPKEETEHPPAVHPESCHSHHDHNADSSHDEDPTGSDHDEPAAIDTDGEFEVCREYHDNDSGSNEDADEVPHKQQLSDWTCTLRMQALSEDLRTPRRPEKARGYFGMHEWREEASLHQLRKEIISSRCSSTASPEVPSETTSGSRRSASRRERPTSSSRSPATSSCLRTLLRDYGSLSSTRT